MSRYGAQPAGARVDVSGMLLDFRTGSPMAWRLTWNHTGMAEAVPHDMPEASRLQLAVLAALKPTTIRAMVLVR
jgi:hypothetical protein